MQFLPSLIQNPVKVTVGVLLVVLFGAIAMRQMPKQLTPHVDNPVISVETRWPGASPQDVEREIIQEQEEQLKAVPSLIKMSSESMDSRGRITLEFAVGTDINVALFDVNARLQQVPEYPVTAREPTISARNTSDRAIARFVLTSKPPSRERIAQFISEHPDLAEDLRPVETAINPGLMVYRLQKLYQQKGEEFPELEELLPPQIDPNKLRRFVEDVIETRFERVPGVADAEVYGGLQEELQVIVDPDRLAGRKLTLLDVRAALAGQNIDTSSGDVWEDKRRWTVRTIGQFRDPDEVANLVLTVRNGVPVYIRDVADVKMGYKKPDSKSRRYGISSNGLSIQRETDANVMQVMKGIRAATAEMNDGILRARDLELYQYYDETTYIQSAIGLVQQNIFIGGALTMITLMLFLQRSWPTFLMTPLIAASAVAAAYVSPWLFLICLTLIIATGLWSSRGALVVGLAIPTSIVGTFLLLGILGRSLNVISLAGMAFAVGMLVDNAVVVLENIHRLREQGLSAFEAAVRGTREVGGAVVASTLTTIAVFLPVVFVQDVAGQLFLDIALAISCAVGLSLLVSFTLIPVASARLLKRSVKAPRDGSRGRVSESKGYRFGHAIVGLNRWIQGGIVRALLVIVVVVGTSIALCVLFWPAVEYLPTGNRNFVFAAVSPPPGYNMDKLMAMGEKIEQDLEPYWNADRAETSDDLPYPAIHYYFFTVRGRQVYMGLQADDAERARELLPLLKQVGTQFPGTNAMAKQSSLFERGTSSGRTIDIEISGPDLNRLVDLGQMIKTRAVEVLPEAQANARPSLDLSNPEVQLRRRGVEAAQMNMSSAELGFVVDALVDGAYAGDYFVNGDKVDLTVIGRREDARRTQDLEHLPVATPTGELVPLAALAHVKLGSGPEQINRRERQRAVTIQVNPPIEIPLEEAMATIQSEIIEPLQQGTELDGGYSLALSGTADKLRQTWRSLRWYLALSVVITYLLMAALFESWLYPLVIIFSVPLGAVGGILGLKVLNLFVLQPLDILTMLGFVILVGTVVNNAILIVHKSLHLMNEDHLTPDVAIPQAVQARIRPILITTMTTVCGLLPLVLFPGAGSELYRGIGSVLLGGLIVSTLLTMIVVPTVFRVAIQTKTFLSGLVGLRAAAVAEPVVIDAIPEPARAADEEEPVDVP